MSTSISAPSVTAQGTDRSAALTGSVAAATGKVAVTDALADGPVYLLRLQARRGVNDIRAARALRALLKIALRRFQLRCLSVREEGWR